MKTQNWIEKQVATIVQDDDRMADFVLFLLVTGWIVIILKRNRKI